MSNESLKARVLKLAADRYGKPSVSVDGCSIDIGQWIISLENSITVDLNPKAPAESPIWKAAAILLGLPEEGKRQPAQLEEEITKLKSKIDFSNKWHAARYAQLDAWVREQPNEELKRQYFNIIANGVPKPFDPPTYAQQFNALLHKCEAYEKALKGEANADEILSIWGDKALYVLVEEMQLPSPAMGMVKAKPIEWVGSMHPVSNVFHYQGDKNGHLPHHYEHFGAYDYAIFGHDHEQFRAKFYGVEEIVTIEGDFTDWDSAKAAAQAHKEERVAELVRLADFTPAPDAQPLVDALKEISNICGNPTIHWVQRVGDSGDIANAVLKDWEGKQ